MGITGIVLVISKVAFLAWCMAVYLRCGQPSRLSKPSRLARLGWMAIVYLVPALNLYYPSFFFSRVTQGISAERLGATVIHAFRFWKWSFIGAVMFALIDSAHGAILVDMHDTVPVSTVLTVLKLNLAHFAIQGWLSFVAVVLVRVLPV